MADNNSICLLYTSQPLMDQQPAPWTLYIVGAILALVLTMIKVPALAFALGMYIPLELNTPLLVGGLIAHFVSTRSKDEKINNARRERGTLIASGFIAGGALMGAVSYTHLDVYKRQVSSVFSASSGLIKRKSG